MGHPCCSFVNCKTPLIRTTDHFCPIHNELNLECCVVGCSLPRTPRHSTCIDPQHRLFEQNFVDSRASGHRTVRASRSAKTFDVGDNGNGLSTSRELRARFTRSWTHNEQLMVRPCGIIIGRATFYNSESLVACKVPVFPSGIFVEMNFSAGIY
jgi:hypothetical protein